MKTKTPAAPAMSLLDSDPTTRSGPGLRVVLYLRQSDREQRLSISQQRSECRAYAASRGWIIVAEFIDDGKSGSKEVAKRTSFARLLDDAEKKERDWSAILCWDTSRFGRLDSMTGAPYKLRLRRAGVWLETAKGERIDWSTSMGRLMDALRAEADNQYSLDISRNCIRGRRAILDLGYSPRPVPYGFDRAYYEADVIQKVVPRRKLFSKPRNWHVKPVPNEQEAEVIRWAYEQWGKRDMSFLRTMRELKQKGIPSPSGLPSWTIGQVKKMLTERMYAGDLHIGRGNKTKEVHYRDGASINENAIPPIIDRELWNIVQAKVKQREGAEWRPKSNSGALSSVLKYGHCGYTLARRRYGPYQYFVCDSASKRPHLGCRQWRVAEGVILPIVCREIVAAVDLEVLAGLTVAEPEQPDANKIELLRQDEKRLAAQVQKASKNMLLIDPENFAAAQTAMAELRREHERAAKALKLAEADVTEDRRSEWVKWWEGVKGTLVEVAPPTDVATPLDDLGRHLHLTGPDLAVELTVEGLNAVTYHRPALQASPEAVRDLLRRLSVEVHLHWEVRNPESKQPRYRLTTGTLRAEFAPNNSAIALDLASDDSATRFRRARRSGWRPVPSR